MRINPISTIVFKNSQPLRPIYCIQLEDGTQKMVTEPEAKEHQRLMELKKQEKKKQEELKKQQDWLALIQGTYVQSESYDRYKQTGV